MLAGRQKDLSLLVGQRMPVLVEENRDASKYSSKIIEERRCITGLTYWGLDVQ